MMIGRLLNQRSGDDVHVDATGLPDDSLADPQSADDLEALGGPYVWLEDLSLDSIGGWLATAQSTGVEPSVLVSQEPVRIEWGDARPDVFSALGVHAREFRVRWPLADHGFTMPIDLRVEFPGSPNAAPFELRMSPNDVLDRLADAEIWRFEVPTHVQTWREFGRSTPMSEDLVESHEGRLGAVLAAPVAPGPRQDLVMSNFQAHRYHRHIREHQGYWKDRHRPLATRNDLVDYLLWSLKEFAHAHPREELPVQGSDRETLNAAVPGSGPMPWNSLAYSGSLDLTRAQTRFSEAKRSIPVREASDYADLLLAWLGYWGHGHRGLALITEAQRRFLSGSQTRSETPTIMEIADLSPFALARWRDSEYFRGRYPNLSRLVERYAFLNDLWCAELMLVESPAFVPSWFVDVQVDTTAEATEGSRRGSGLLRSTVAAENVDVRVLGMISSKSGLGQNARNSLAAFRSLGLSCVEQEIALNDRTVESKSTVTDRRSASINLWHVNPDNLPEAMLLAGEGICGDAYNIGFFAWELDRQPQTHELAVELVDELWVPSDFCRRSFQTITDKPITVMPHAIVPPAEWIPKTRAALGLPDNGFIVYAGFDLHSWPGRKNPLGVVRAYQEAFRGEKSAVLLLRVRNGHNLGLVDSDPDDLGQALLDIAQDDPSIIVDMQERSYGDVLSLVARADCYLSLHRAEGFGYGPAEALFVGTPLVVASNTAVSEFCFPEHCHLVPCVERYLTPGEYYLSPGGARWFEPDIREAARLLRWVHDNPSESRQMAEAGREYAANQLSLHAMSQIYGHRFSEILGRAGVGAEAK